MLVVGARNNDVRKQWSKEDRKAVDAALLKGRVNFWTYLRAEGRWGGGREHSRCIILCAPEKKVYLAANRIAALLQQDAILVIKMGAADLFDTRALKRGMPRPKPRVLRPSEVDA